MQIFSDDGKSWLVIEHSLGEQGHSSVSVEVSANIEHSVFYGKNSDMHFLNIAEFITQLDAFITNRDIEPKLVGTYDSYISFKGSTTDVTLSFDIGSSFCGVMTYAYSVTGSFEVHQEQLNDILDKFRSFESLV